jgi:PAS domain S-box-containing protein
MPETEDTQELQTIEQQLAETEARYRVLVEKQIEAMCRWLPDTTLTYVSEGYCRLSGRQQSDLVGRKWIEVVPESSRDTALRSIGSLGGKPGPTTYEHELTGANGQTVWLSWNTYPLINQDGKVVEFQSVGRTITEHKEAEEALRESEQRFRDLADKAPVGIYILEGATAVYVNQAFAEMHGYTSDELIGKDKMRELTHPDDWKKAEERLKRRISGGPGYREKLSFRGITKTGKTIYVEGHSAVTTYQGRPATIGIGIDVTEQKNIEEELEKYRSHLEKLVAEKTTELNQANEELRQDIVRRQQVEKELEIKTENLQEANVALKVLLRQGEDYKEELEEKVYSNVKELVLRHVSLLRNTHMVDTDQKMLLDIIEINLKKLISPFSKRIGAFNFTPKEMEVVALIREGKTTKEIASLLNVSLDAVSQHRYQIRRKLDLNRKKTGLRSYLLSLE